MRFCKKGRFDSKNTIIVLVISMLLFVSFNLIGAQRGGWKYEGTTTSLTDNMMESTKQYQLKDNLDILSRDNTTLARIQYMVSFDLPTSENTITIIMNFTVQPVVYDFYLFNDQLFESIEAEVTETLIGAGNETLEFISTENTPEKIVLFSGNSSIQFNRVLPPNWFSSTNKTLHIAWGNFKIIRKEQKSDGRMLSGNRQLRVIFTEEDFFKGSDITIINKKWQFYSDFSVHFNAERPVRIQLTILIAILVIVANIVFTSDIVNSVIGICKKETPKVNNREVADIRITKPYNQFIRYARIRGILFSTSTLLFIYSVLIYFTAYIWFGAPAVKDYAYVCVLIALIFYLLFLFVMGLLKNQKNRILRIVEDSKEIYRKKLSDIERRYTTVINEIISTIASLMTLYFFIFGPSAFQSLWF